MHVGIVMIVSLAIGFVMPPLGPDLVMAAQGQHLARRGGASHLFSQGLTLIAALSIITAWPTASLLLPRILLDFGR